MKKGALMFIILRLNVYQSLKRLLQKHHQQPQSQLPQQEVSIRSIHSVVTDTNLVSIFFISFQKFLILLSLPKKMNSINFQSPYPDKKNKNNTQKTGATKNKQIIASNNILKNNSISPPPQKFPLI